MDTSPATIECLPLVVQAVKRTGKNIPVLLDGGVVNGASVLKVLPEPPVELIVKGVGAWGCGCDDWKTCFVGFGARRTERSGACVDKHEGRIRSCDGCGRM